MYIYWTFNSKDKGYEAKNIDDLIDFKQNNDFPTLGSFSDRDEWTKKTNQIIERVSKQNLIDFIRIDHLTNDLKKDEVLDDNVHLVSKLFEQIYERINIINESNKPNYYDLFQDRNKILKSKKD